MFVNIGPKSYGLIKGKFLKIQCLKVCKFGIKHQIGKVGGVKP